MKFDYGYRDQGNERHAGVIAAHSRDDAFRLLRARGVKPTFVEPSKGVWNRILSLGRRGFAIVGLAILSAVAIFLALTYRDTLRDAETAATAPLTRRQIYGDPALMERLQEENYASLFPAEGDRILAHFAQPAQTDRYVHSLRRDRKVRAAAIRALEELAAAPAAAAVRPVGGTSRETSELGRIVRWMRGEFSDYLANGFGTPASYLRRLLERQQYESQLLLRARRELDGVKDPAVWENRNAELRAIGAPTLAMPEDAP